MALRSLTRVCDVCRHRLITVVLDNGEIMELDTERHCYVLTGREKDGIPIYIGSRGYVDHDEVCAEKRGDPYAT